MNTAAHLHALIGDHLIATGTGTRSHKQVAAFLGMPRQFWARHLIGQHSPQERTINGWLDACRDAGIEVPDSVARAVGAPE